MKSKPTAIILCFFFGWLGVHKFYLGQNVAGILYLLFCWTLIPSFIAFIEFFLLVFMTDADFDAKYNQGRSSTVGSAKDTTNALADLKNLYDSGVITAEEYEEKRQKLLKAL